MSIPLKRYEVVGISTDTTRHRHFNAVAFVDDTFTLWAIRDICHHIKEHRLGVGTLFRFIKDYLWR